MSTSSYNRYSFKGLIRPNSKPTVPLISRTVARISASAQLGVGPVLRFDRSNDAALTRDFAVLLIGAANLWAYCLELTAQRGGRPRIEYYPPEALNPILISSEEEAIKCLQSDIEWLQKCDVETATLSVIIPKLMHLCSVVVVSAALANISMEDVLMLANSVRDEVIREFI